MRLPSRLRSALRTLAGREARERELDDELRFHLESAIEEHRARGLDEAEARRRAQLEFGAVQRYKEEVRESWTLAWIPALARDVRLAVRGFRRRPAYAGTVVVTLALAVGAAVAIFGALWAVVVAPLPFADDEQLVVLGYAERGSGERVGLSPLEVADYREAGVAVADLVERHTMNFTLLGHGEPRRVRTAVVSAHYFSLLGVKPLHGRDLVATDDQAGAPPVLLLSYRFWLSQLGGDESLLGADFTMNDRVHTVVGILPPLPGLPEEADVFMPVAACPFRSGPMWSTTRTARGLQGLARLEPGWDLERATVALRGIGERLAESHPEAYPPEAGLEPRLVSLRDEVTIAARPTLWLLAGAAACMLLLVVANLTNLSLAQFARRRAEFAVRATLGGDRARLARQLGLESTLLALAGGGLGVAFAAASSKLLSGFLASLTPRAFEIRLGLGGVAAALALAAAVGLAIGLAPLALGQGRLFSALRADDATASAGGGSTRLRDALVTFQVAASFVLLIGAGLLLRSLLNLQSVPTGVSHSEVVALDLPHNWSRYADDASQIGFADRLLERIGSLPGVESVALSDTYPLHSDLPWSRRVAVGEAPPDPQLPGPGADFRMVTPDYFDTVGVPIVAGRSILPGDRDEDDPVVVVNETLVRQLFPDRDPIGQRIAFSSGDTSWRIVGVVADVRQRGLRDAPRAEAYAPIALTGGGGFSLLVRSPAGLSLVPAVRQAIHSIDAEQPVIGARTLAEARKASLDGPRMTAALLAVAALLALFIAAAGLAGLLAFTLGQRTREFGVRLALGATRGDIAWLVLGRTSALVGGGVLLGALGATAFTRGLDSMLFGLASSDPATYLGVAMVLAGTAGLSVLSSLRRALATAPSLALRVV